MPQDHYAVLGVQDSDDITLIKRRYRQLARTHHPDAAAPSQQAQAHETMLALNAAWGVLSNPAERARYDRTRMERLQAQFKSAPSPSSSPSPDEIIIHPPRSNSWDNATPRRAPQSGAPASSANNTKTATQSRNAYTPRTSQNTSSTRRAPTDQSGSRKPTPSRLLSIVFEAAELYFFHGRAEEAIALCQSVFAIEPNHAEAHALLGDIYADQGQREIAARMYARAAQSSPSNPTYRRKWDELRGTSATAKSTAQSPSNAANFTVHAHADRSIFDDDDVSTSSTRTSSTRTSSTRSSHDAHDESKYASREYGGRDFAAEARGRAWFGLALIALSMLFAVLAGLRAAPNASRVPFSWSPAAPIMPDALFCLALAGVALGAALPMLGLAKRFASLEKGNAQSLAPTMLVVAIVGVSWSPMAPLIALAAGVFGRRWNFALWFVMLLALVLSSALMWRAPTLANDALLWWSGRIALPALLSGWALGALGSLD